MGTNSKIEWTDHTFNPWTGCQHVSPGCDGCYAEAQAKRNGTTFGGWGPGAQRKRTSESYWRQPLKWNSEALKAGIRRRVFCASMADVFDNAVPEDWRIDLWRLIAETPALDWLLLTKRPQNIRKMLPSKLDHGAHDWANGPWLNVWLGTTVENQAAADARIPHLLATPAAVRFLSCEPLLGPVDVEPYLSQHYQSECVDWPKLGCIDWVIAGGESGPGARPMHPDWARSLRDQCAAAGVPFFFKQWGEHLPEYDRDRDDPDWRACDQWGRKPGRWINLAGGHGFHGDRVHYAHRVGKKAAGRTLDGAQHDGMPTSSMAAW